MPTSRSVTGRLIDPQTVRLDSPVQDVMPEVEVILRPLATEGRQFDSFDDFLNSLPPGTRTREDIDAQIKEERDSWGER